MVNKMRDLVRSGYNQGKYDKVYARKNTKLEPFENLMCNELISRIFDEFSYCNKKDSKPKFP